MSYNVRYSLVFDTSMMSSGIERFGTYEEAQRRADELVAMTQSPEVQKTFVEVYEGAIDDGSTTRLWSYELNKENP